MLGVKGIKDACAEGRWEEKKKKKTRTRSTAKKRSRRETKASAYVAKWRASRAGTFPFQKCPRSAGRLLGRDEGSERLLEELRMRLVELENGKLPSTHEHARAAAASIGSRRSSLHCVRLWECRKKDRRTGRGEGRREPLYNSRRKREPVGRQICCTTYASTVRSRSRSNQGRAPSVAIALGKSKSKGEKLSGR